MAHTQKSREKLLGRVRKIRGQLNAVEAGLSEDRECSEVLHTLAACRGAMNSLLLEIVEGHIRFHVVDPENDPDPGRAEAAQQLIDVLRTYLR